MTEDSTLSNSSPLKPCPFCGEEELLNYQELSRGAHVFCDGCGTTGPFFLKNYTPQMVKDAWNKRA